MNEWTKEWLNDTNLFERKKRISCKYIYLVFIFIKCIKKLNKNKIFTQEHLSGHGEVFEVGRNLFGTNEVVESFSNFNSGEVQGVMFAVVGVFVSLSNGLLHGTLVFLFDILTIFINHLTLLLYDQHQLLIFSILIC